MKVIIGINLGEGNRNQSIEELKKQNPHLVYSTKLIDSDSLEKILHKTVNKEKIIEAIYEKIKDRIDKIRKSNKAIVIVQNNLSEYNIPFTDKYDITSLFDHYISDSEEVNTDKMNLIIKNEMKKKVLKLDENRFVFGIGGLSESGKSSTGQILLKKYGIPNFKFNYINDVIKKTYGLSEEDDLFDDNREFSSILVIDEISHMMRRMYYWDIISIESLHSFINTKIMKEVFPDNFIVLYLKTDDFIRTFRNSVDFDNDIEKSEKEIEKKDNTKKSRGADKVETIANFIIENNGDIAELENKLYNIINLVKGGFIEMRNRAGGMLIEDGKILLMHRIKNIDGETREYYVVPGGGIEEGETLEDATKRELKEEMGIDVELLSDEPLLSLLEEKGTQYFTLVKKISGKIGTGKGPEFSDTNYANRGFYGPEMVDIKDIINGKVKMVPDEIKEEFISIVSSYDIDSLNSSDLVSKKINVLRKNK